MNKVFYFGFLTQKNGNRIAVETFYSDNKDYLFMDK